MSPYQVLSMLVILIFILSFIPACIEDILYLSIHRGNWLIPICLSLQVRLNSLINKIYIDHTANSYKLLLVNNKQFSIEQTSTIGSNIHHPASNLHNIYLYLSKSSLSEELYITFSLIFLILISKILKIGKADIFAIISILLFFSTYQTMKIILLSSIFLLISVLIKYIKNLFQTNSLSRNRRLYPFTREKSSATNYKFKLTSSLQSHYELMSKINLPFVPHIFLGMCVYLALGYSI